MQRASLSQSPVPSFPLPTPLSTVYIGIGSNIDAEINMALCGGRLKALFPDIRFSGVYETAPREAMGQADFWNAVAKIETAQSPEELHAMLQKIEKDLKKKPPYPKGPRTIDLDILLYDDRKLNIPIKGKKPEKWDTGIGLTVPHPRMHQRRFVLEPLCELIAPNAQHPTLGKPWKELLKETADQRCTKTNFRL